MLLGVEAVQKELELVEAQMDEIRKLNESMRGGGPGGPGGPGGRANFQEMTQEERDKWREDMQKQMAERTAKAKKELAGILLSEQQKRLQEIYVQVNGTQALNDADVAAAIGLTDDQKAKMDTIRDEAGNERRDLFQNAGDDREGMMEKMTALQKQTEEKLVAVLSADQQTKFAELKGKPFDMPEDALRGGFGGRGGRGGGGRGNRGGNRGGDNNN